MYFYLDESGCVGFDLSKEGTSRYIILTMIVVQDDKPLKNFVKRWKQRKIGKNIQEVKWSKTNDVLRKDFLQKLSRQPVKIYTMIVNKERVHSGLQKQKDKLYNYVAGLLMENYEDSTAHEFYIEIDRSKTKKLLREDFDNYIRRKLIEQHKTKEKPIRVEIKHPFSYESLGVQVADMASGAIAYYYERGDSRYIQLIQENIVDERKLFWDWR